MAHKGGFQG
jgi:Ca2+-binding EF-hand superfamily protein